MEEVGRLLGERHRQVASVADEDHPRREGEEHHLVRVPRDRAGEVNPADPMPMGRREQRRRAVRAVHVEPEPARRTQPADRLEVIERAGRRLADGRDHREDGSSRRRELVEHHTERGRTHPVSVGRHLQAVRRAEPHRPHRPLDRVVRMRTAEHHRRGPVAPTVLPGVGLPRRARGQQRREGRLRPPRRHRAGGRGAPADELRHPADDAFLQHRRGRGHLPHRHGVVERTDDHLAPDRGRERRRDLMPEVHRVQEVVRVAQDIAVESRRDVVERPHPHREGLIEARGDLAAAERGRNRSVARPRVREAGGRHPEERAGGLERRVRVKRIEKRVETHGEVPVAMRGRGRLDHRSERRATPRARPTTAPTRDPPSR